MRAKDFTPTNSQIILYADQNGTVKLDVRFDGDTVWLSQKMMAELFGCSPDNIGLHLKNIFRDGELDVGSVAEDFSVTASDGKRYHVKHFNLDAIISVGYRVNSGRATQFRIWATRTLKEFLIKGFVVDDDRLKNPDVPFDYFEELSRRIQDIRTSEKRFYRKITDIYALSVDYDPTDELSIQFFKTVQNKMHWAITGKTAAEIIVDRANGMKANMGLTNWRGPAPRKDDALIAKNYLTTEELAALNNLVEQYLIFAEGQAMRRVEMKMRDWLKKLDGFLQLNDRDILTDAGQISHLMAKEIAEREFDKFNAHRIYLDATKEDEFDKVLARLNGEVEGRRGD
jgi:hypothetical protein